MEQQLAGLLTLFVSDMIFVGRQGFAIITMNKRECDILYFVLLLYHYIKNFFVKSGIISQTSSFTLCNVINIQLFSYCA